MRSVVNFQIHPRFKTVTRLEAVPYEFEPTESELQGDRWSRIGYRPAFNAIRQVSAQLCS